MPYEQRNSLVVGFIMGFAVIPVIFTISEDALSNVPPSLIAASEALGASRWQMVRTVVLPVASAGIFSALMIGLGRAVGETMIVLMATGNTPIMDWNIFNGMRTLSANIATELPEAAQDSIPLPGPLPGRPYPLLHDIHSEHSGGNSAPASPQTLQRRVNHPSLSLPSIHLP